MKVKFKDLSGFLKTSIVLLWMIITIEVLGITYYVMNGPVLG